MLFAEKSKDRFRNKKIFQKITYSSISLHMRILNPSSKVTCCEMHECGKHDKVISKVKKDQKNIMQFV